MVRRLTILAALAVAIGFGGAPAPMIDAVTSITVDTTADSSGTCNDGDCSLREAINAANSGPADTIVFNIPGPAPHVIVPQSSLPDVTQSLTIDGTSAPDYSNAPVIVIDGAQAGPGTGVSISASSSDIVALVICNFSGAGVSLSGANDVVLRSYIGTDASGLHAAPNALGVSITAGAQTIGYPGSGTNVISGNHGPGVSIGAGAGRVTLQNSYVGVDASGNGALPNGGDGVTIASAGALVGGELAGEGNVISGNGGAGVNLTSDAHNGVVAGNIIGANASGVSALPNATGVRIAGAANTIGGHSISARNIISGNGEEGIRIDDASGNTIAANYIGTDASGASALGNQLGIYLNHADGTLIGGLYKDEHNIISGNRGTGVTALSSSNLIIEGNTIGAGAGGGALGNGGTGIVIGASSANAQNNQIGGADLGQANTIAYNHGAGVSILAGEGHAVNANTLRANAIFANSGLGVDLLGDGVTPNDPTDADDGPNLLQNYPELSSALPGASVTINGSMQSTPSTPFMLDLYDNDSCDPSGHGQGQRYIGSFGFFVGVSGQATFHSVVDGVSLPVGHFVTAVAVNLNTSDTSEFANCVEVRTPDTATATPTRTRTPTRTPTSHAGATVTQTPSAQPGDVNCDRTVNSIDAALTLQYGAGLLHTLSCLAAADANHDGQVNSIDAALVLQYSAGLVHTL